MDGDTFGVMVSAAILIVMVAVGYNEIRKTKIEIENRTQESTQKFLKETQPEIEEYLDGVWDYKQAPKEPYKIGSYNWMGEEIENGEFIYPNKFKKTLEAHQNRMKDEEKAWGEFLAQRDKEYDIND